MLSLMDSVKKHLAQIFKSEKSGPPWPRMILCAYAMGLPLLAGAASGSVHLSIYGSLTGYLLALNDHLGNLKHRILVSVLTFAFVIAGFAAGIALRGHPLAFSLILGALVYWLGILGGEGAELERGAVFSVIGMVLIFSSPQIPHQLLLPIFMFCLLGFVSLFAGIPILNLVLKRRPEQFSGLRQSFQKSFTIQKEKHLHAACYTLMVLISMVLTHQFRLQKGYWVTMTVLLVMRAERTQSIYKTLQRLIGTALAVLFCDVILQWVRGLEPTMALGILCAFLVPWALKKNYLYASFVMTVMVVALLEIGSGKFGDLEMTFLRLEATWLGCLLSLFGTLLSKMLSLVPVRQRE